jgi:hypothetical protein
MEIASAPDPQAALEERRQYDAKQARNYRGRQRARLTSVASPRAHDPTKVIYTRVVHRDRTIKDSVKARRKFFVCVG